LEVQMTRDEYDALLAGLPQVYRTIMAEAAKGPVTAPRLRAPCNRGDGLTKELGKLMKLGLLRDAGRDTEATTNGIKPMIYVAVPMGEVEQAAADCAARQAKAGGKRKRRRGSVRRRLAEMPKRQPGDRGLWLELRRNTMRATANIESVSDKDMAFWGVVTSEDLLGYVDDLADLTDVLAGLMRTLELRVEDDDLRRKIAALAETNGRTEHELRAADGLIVKLRRQRKVLG
jgi:hypothetical protein